ncbi:MAG: gamma-glutamyltransferase [Caulobacter sp.]|nr:gamma-glutamyltransferase [Caulobacter sp.]
MRPLIAALTALSLALSGCSTVAAKPEPAAANGPVMVAAANPLAVEAGLAVLRRGGSAVDAAVAVQAVLGLVEPQSSGLGGGAFMVHYDAETKAVTTYDGRETAPAGADAKMFLGPDGRPMNFIEAVLSGRSTGVPGAIAMLHLAQTEHGTLPWNSLFGDAERLATEGFKVSPRMASFITSIYPQSRTPDATDYFTRPDGKRYGIGDTLKNPAYAQSLRLIAEGGADGLLKGPLGEAIVARVADGPMPGALSAKDLAGYRPLKKKALCSTYRIYQICTAPPASSGVVLLQALNILEHTDIATRGPSDPVAWLQIAQAERLMYADRDRYVGDPDFVSVPVGGLLDDGYAAERAKLIGDRFGPPPPAGTPPGARARAPDRTLEPAGTSHMVIVDARGDVVSMTTTVESIYGSGRMVGGFFLNNQLTDFNFAPTDPDGAPAANAVAPGKRPRSSMSPVIILDRQGRFVAGVGSPGGSSILSYNLKTLVGVLDWNLTMQQAIDLPNLIAKGSSVSGEARLFSPGVVAAMAERGLTIQAIGGEDSGVQGIIVREGGRLEGGADPRREGVAKGL